MREETSNWMRQAEKDLKAARNSLKSGDYEWASFQANQASEKILKALYLETKKKSVPTHNLISLGKDLDVPKEVFVLLQELNSDYTLARYPDAANAVPFELYTEKKALEKIRAAEEVFAWTKKQLRL